jgi:choloylglycine hydrolase
LHLINTIDIPYGPQIWIQNGKDNIQWTIWSVIYDLTQKHFYYRTYQNPTLRRIDLTKLPLGKDGKRARFDLFGGDTFIEDTGRFISSAK